MSHYKIDACEKCGKPKGSYKKRLENEHVVCIRDDRVIMFEESGTEADKSDDLKEILTALANKEISDNIKSAIGTVQEHLNRAKTPITTGEPEISEVGTCRLKTIINRLSDFQGCNSGILPRECSFYKRIVPNTQSDVDAVHMFCMTKPPHVTSYRHSPSGSNTTTYSLSIPFLHFFVTVKSLQNTYSVDNNHTHYFITTKPFANLDDPVYRLPFGNQGNDGRLCWGRVKLPSSKDVPMHKYVEGVFNALFQSTWNDDLRHDSPMPAGITSYADWASQTEKDAFFSLKGSVSWNRYAPNMETLEGVVNHVSSSYGE